MIPGYALNGAEIVPIEDVQISLLSGVVNYGLGCFEGIRGYWNTSTQQLYIFRLKDHLRRLQYSAEVLHIDLPVDLDELAEAIVELLRAENCHEDVYIRPLAYKKDLAMGARLDRMSDAILTWASPINDDARAARGLKVCISDTQRIDTSAIPSHAKLTGAYINPLLARTNAQLAGFDDCIILNSQGRVAEGSGWNILLLNESTVVSPEPGENILEGITRDTLLKLACKKLGLSVEERAVHPDELATANEVLACGTGIQILPIVEIDGVRVGDGQVGERFQQFWELYYQLVQGSIKEYEQWLTPVYPDPEN